MNEKLKILLVSFLIGVGIGNLVAPVYYLWNELGHLSLSTYISVSFFSGLLGLVSAFLFGLQDYPDKVALPLHYLLISALVLSMNVYNGWFDGASLPYLWLFFLQFTMIYILVWGLMVYLTKQKISKMESFKMKLAS